jgi:hypothetical protein
MPTVVGTQQRALNTMDCKNRTGDVKTFTGVRTLPIEGLRLALSPALWQRALGYWIFSSGRTKPMTQITIPRRLDYRSAE